MMRRYVGSPQVYVAAVRFVAPAFRGFDPAKKAVRAQREIVDDLARRYPAWAALHPGACPRGRDLGEPTWSDGSDLWGNEYVVRCSATGAAVISRGPDGDLDTDDDIRALSPRS